jgi:hypothetical protein
MDQVGQPVAVPGRFKAIAWAGMVWNTLGAALYLWAKLDPAAAGAGASAAMQDYIANMPLYAHIGWSLGIWGSFAGSAAMLMGKRLAVPAFLVSLLGALASFGAQARAGVLEVPMTVFILAIIGGLLWYSRRAATQGILK